MIVYKSYVIIVDSLKESCDSHVIKVSFFIDLRMEFAEKDEQTREDIKKEVKR